MERLAFPTLKNRQLKNEVDPESPFYKCILGESIQNGNDLFSMLHLVKPVGKRGHGKPKC